MNKYKILPPKIKRGKFIYHLIKREEMVALYDQRKNRKPDRVCGYVVARIRKKKKTKLPNGVLQPNKEKFPSESEFGKNGWFYMEQSFQLASSHFNELVERDFENMPPKIRVNEESEGTTHFEDQRGLNGGDGIVA